MRYGVVALVFGMAVGGVPGMRPAGAVKPFLEQFKTLYVKPKSTDRTMQIFNLAVEKKDCSLCHLPKPKKGFNAYGSNSRSCSMPSGTGRTRRVFAPP